LYLKVCFTAEKSSIIISHLLPDSLTPKCRQDFAFLLKLIQKIDFQKCMVQKTFIEEI